MRRRRPIAYAGFAVTVAAAAIGFASFTATHQRAPQATVVDLPDTISGRVSAGILVSRLSTMPQTETSPDDGAP